MFMAGARGLWLKQCNGHSPSLTDAVWQPTQACQGRLPQQQADQLLGLYRQSSVCVLPCLLHSMLLTSRGCQHKCPLSLVWLCRHQRLPGSEGHQRHTPCCSDIKPVRQLGQVRLFNSSVLAVGACCLVLGEVSSTDRQTDKQAVQTVNRRESLPRLSILSGLVLHEQAAADGQAATLGFKHLRVPHSIKRFAGCTPAHAFSSVQAWCTNNQAPTKWGVSSCPKTRCEGCHSITLFELRPLICLLNIASKVATQHLVLGLLGLW